MKVILVKKVMSCDVSPVAMFQQEGFRISLMAAGCDLYFYTGAARICTESPSTIECDLETSQSTSRFEQDNFQCKDSHNYPQKIQSRGA